MMFRRLADWWRRRRTWRAVAMELRDHVAELRENHAVVCSGLAETIDDYRKLVDDKARLLDERDADARQIEALRGAVETERQRFRDMVAVKDKLIREVEMLRRDQAARHAGPHESLGRVNVVGQSGLVEGR